MKLNRFLSSLLAMLFVALTLPVGAVVSPVRQSGVNVVPAAYHRRTARSHVRRRSRKKSAAIVGGSALGGAAIGGLAGGGKGAAIGALAGGGAGYVYDRKTQNKPIVPK